MKCPKCETDQPDYQKECSRCGLIFEKYWNRKKIKTVVEPAVESGWFGAIFLHVEDDVGQLNFWFRVVVLAGILFLGMRYILMPIEKNEIANSIFHLINLPFHEAGHIFFRPFGRIMTSLGGSLMQLLVPLVCMFTLLIKTRDTFGAAITLWWFGENFLDLAPYINDARSLSIPLLGGNFGYSSPYGFHDWEFILSELNLLHYDHFFAKISQVSGSAIMVSAYIWCIYILSIQFRNCYR